MVGFFAFVILIGGIFSYIYNAPEILTLAIIVSIFSNIISYWFSDTIVLVMTHAKPVALKDNPELYRIVENLSISGGLPMPKVYIIEEPQMNAFATGRDPNHAVIAVTRGLLEKLEDEELEGVIAHELSHIGNRDMLLGTVAVVLVGLISFLSDWFLRSSLYGGRSRDDNNKGSSIVLIIGIVLTILAPLIATIMRLAISRKRELLADASGALMTRYPEGLASALEKIADDKTPLRVANHATAHLFLANPFRGKEALGFLTNLFQTHPPITERIRRLREMGRGV